MITFLTAVLTCRRLVLPPTAVRLLPSGSWSDRAKSFLRGNTKKKLKAGQASEDSDAQQQVLNHSLKSTSVSYSLVSMPGYPTRKALKAKKWHLWHCIESSTHTQSASLPGLRRLQP